MAVAYRYTARYPVGFDASARPSWPVAAYNRLRDVVDVVEFSFSEDAASWVRQRTEEVRTESRRLVVEAVTYSVDAAAAETARLALFAELDKLRSLFGENLIITRDSVEAFILPTTAVIGGPTRSAS